MLAPRSRHFVVQVVQAAAGAISRPARGLVAAISGVQRLRSSAYYRNLEISDSLSQLQRATEIRRFRTPYYN